jgi:hypothetical protein
MKMDIWTDVFPKSGSVGWIADIIVLPSGELASSIEVLLAGGGVEGGERVGRNCQSPVPITAPTSPPYVLCTE